MASHNHPITPTLSGQGFSLIELLVVLLIVGLMSSLVVVNLRSNGDSEQPAERQAYQLAALLRLGRAEAIVSATPLGLVQQGDESPQGPALHWLSWQGNHWVGNDMKQFPLTPETGLQWLSASGGEVGRRSNQINGDEETAPDIVFYPTGEITPFLLRMGEMTLQLDDFGNVQVSQNGNVIGASQGDSR